MGAAICSLGGAVPHELVANPQVRLKERGCVLTFFMNRAPGDGVARCVVLSTVTRSALEMPTIEKQEATSEEIEMPWNVIVHNDPINLMSYVTMVFQRVFGYPRERAESIC